MNAIEKATTREIRMPADGVTLPGTLTLPAKAAGLVIFAHGSGSSRFSPRNRLVAEVLHQHGIGTLLFDLLTEFESHDRRNVFNIELLAERLDRARRWVEAELRPEPPVLGYFGASTGAAAALVAEADHLHSVAAIVSRGGRPDLAGEALGRVTAPTLLLVGGADYDVLQLNREALRLVRAPKELRVIPQATHLFEEPGTLEEVADLAADWFAMHLQKATTAVAP
jgi:putative phosphoribosyl transferase